MLEVLAALAIFALAAVVLGSAYVNVLNAYAAAARGRDADEDAKFARAQLLAEPDREKAELGADFESVNGRRVRWSATIEPTSMPDLFTVTFTCESSDPAKLEPDKVTQTFQILRPTWSEPAERDKLRQDVLTRIQEIQGQKQ